jgi:hypothetical protein
MSKEKRAAAKSEPPAPSGGEHEPASKPAAAAELTCFLCGTKGLSGRRITIKDHHVEMCTDGNDLNYSAGELSRTCDLCPVHASELLAAVATAIEQLGIPTFLTNYGLTQTPTAKECAQ